MRPGSRQIGAGLALLAFAVALVQRPGKTTADTKIDLHVDPLRFLGEVASVWSSSGGLGQVHGGQYSGYLWPMGPFFAAGDLLDLAPWLVHRLWLGVLLAAAAWGIVAFLEATLDRPHRAALVAAGALYVVNPYVTTFTQATSVTLLGYAALPWLMLAVHRGLRSRGGWWWPALFALVFASTGGGVNAAVTGWLLLGPLLLAGYEWLAGAVPRRAAWAFAWRAGLLTVAASAWWVAPVAVHAASGINFLPFTESAGAIWATTSLTESIRLMGYWLSYLGAGFGPQPLPYFDASQEMLFSQPVVVASLVVPALAVTALLWTRRLRYAPFFLLLLLVGLLVMSAGFPDGTPLRRALLRTYNEVEAVQFLRTTYKAGPLVALALAWLGGAAAGELWPRLRGRILRPAVAAGAAGLVAVAAWPLATGRALDDRFTFDGVPQEWQRAAEHVDSQLGDNARALVLPGQLYAFYDWGATVDPILPALAERPVSSRAAVPYSDLRAVDALWTVDAGVQQERFVPGQLEPLLEWLGVGMVVTGADHDPVRSGGTPAAEAARALALAGLGGPTAEWGPRRVEHAEPGSLTPPRGLPRVRAYEVASGALVRVEPIGGGVLLDGSAEGVAGLAAFGALDPARPVAYAGDHDDESLRQAAAEADEVVITDSNRRRVISPARPRQTWGRSLAEDEPLPAGAPRIEPFPRHGEDTQTVAVLRGADYVRAPFTAGLPQFPEHRPFAAFDEDPGTWWEADRQLPGGDRWVEIGFSEPRDVPYAELLPRRQQATAVTAVEVNGRRFQLRPGWNRLQLGLEDVERLRVRIVERDLPAGRRGGPGAIAEIRVPGLDVAEALRPPMRLEQALSDVGERDLAVSYLFSRSTGDRPFRRHAAADPDAAAVADDQSVEPALIRDAGDAERAIEREITPPRERDYDIEAWVSVAPDAPDAALDRLAGYRGPERFRGSARYEGRASVRASRAFDGDLATAWVGRHVPGHRAWLEWRSPEPRAVERLRLVAPPPPAALPSAVRVRAGNASSPVVPVGPGGEVVLPRPLTARTLRLEVAEAPAEAVGIAAVQGDGVPPVRLPRSGTVRGSCGDLRVAASGTALELRVVGRLGDLEADRPLRAVPCGDRPLRIPAGRQLVSVRGDALLPYLVRLRSPVRGDEADAAPPGPPGRVLDAGDGGGSSREGVHVELTEPARIVLAESFDPNWQASCDGRDLGAASVAAGFANGWRVPAGCSEVSFRYGPQGAVTAGYAASGVVSLALLALLLVGAGRRRPLGVGLPRPPGDAGLVRRPLALAIAQAVPLATVVGFVFALRAGAVALPLLSLLLWRGAELRRLLAAAGLLLLLAVPAAYLAFPADDLGGHNSSYAAELLGAHWLAVAAVVLLVLALWRLLPVRRRNGID